MARTIEEFIVKVVTQGADQLDKLGQKTDALNGKINKLAAGILGISFGSFILGALEAADRISDLSDATGISITNLKSFEIALEKSGGKARNVERAINGFVMAIDTANDGSLKVRDAFAAVGVSLDMLKNASEQDILQKTIQGLDEMSKKGKSVSEIASTASTLLTKAFRGVDVAGFFKAFEEGKMTLADVEANIRAAAEANAKLEQKFRTLQQGAVDAMMPILKMMGETELTTATATKLMTALGVALGITFGAQALAAIVTLNMALVGTAAAIGLISKNPLVKLGVGVALFAAEAVGAFVLYEKGAKAAADEAAALEKKQQDLIDQAKKNAAADPTKAGKGNANRAQAEDPRQKAMAESAKRIAQSQAEFERLTQTSLTDEIKNIRLQAEADIKKAKEEIDSKEYLSKAQKAKEFEAKRKEIALKSELDIAKVRADVEQSMSDQMRSISQTTDEKRAQLALEKDSLGLGQGAIDLNKQLLDIEIQRKKAIEDAARVKNADPGDLAKQIELINQQFESQKAVAEQQYQFQREFETGWTRAFGAYLDSATNAANQAQQIFSAMTNGMNSAIDNFVNTGKFSFSDFATSIIKDIIKIQLKAQAAQLFTAGAGFLGFKLPGMAAGGPVGAGQPYMIGEKGPELFIPSSAGTIVPNNKLNNGGGGASNTYITNNISAIDSRSVAQLFAENRQVLFGNVEQARRELPLRTR